MTESPSLPTLHINIFMDLIQESLPLTGIQPAGMYLSNSDVRLQATGQARI